MSKTATYILCLGAIIICLSACQRDRPSADGYGHIVFSDSTFFEYLKKGNAFYAQKSGLNVFQKSLNYFDTAAVIAEKLNDSLLLAESIFARGRVYDAWNRQPQKTVEYFTVAANMLRKHHPDYVRAMYVKYLVAHAYDKIPDSINCIRVLKEMYDEIKPHNDSLRQALNFIPQMALAATEIGNYEFAETILNELTEEEWIHNDPDTYNYKDMYYLTRSRIDVYKYGLYDSPNLMQFVRVFEKAKTAYDSLYYSESLYKLYRHIDRTDLSLQYLEINHILSDRLENKETIEKLYVQLYETELLAQRQNAEIENKENLIQRILWFILGAGILTFAWLSWLFYSKNRMNHRFVNELSISNIKLEKSNRQNQLLYKELHHRVKNNLYMIYSLLQMQERKSGNTEAMEKLKVARMRIESIATLHDQLTPDNEKKVDVKQLLKKLLEKYKGVRQRKIEPVIDASAISIEPRYSFPLTLILNEWIANSVKYAGTEDGILNIFVSARQENDKVTVSYHDNGNVSETNDQTGIGTQIVNLLVKQLDAELNISTPYHYNLTFENL